MPDALPAWASPTGLADDPALAALVPALQRACAAAPGHGRLADWLATLEALPVVPPQPLQVQDGHVVAGDANALDAAAQRALQAGLRALGPWRKGPFRVCGTTIDAEWRSERKWDRLAPHLSDLAGRRVLDVGCGNGWYALRMAAAGAARVLGVDPTWNHLVQYAAVRHCLAALPVQLLPLPLEALPEPANDRGQGAFDSLFSMGVLYHRRDPLEHLRQLRAQLRSGGELVLETLVVRGDAERVLCPPGRYAGMRNIWFLPAVPLLTRWLERLGFRDVRAVDCTATSVDEQRSTAWSPGHSLADALDPADSTRTVEGHPAPLRAVLLATAP